MNEWLKKVFGKLKDLWSKWKPIQKVILIGIIVVVIIAIIAAAKVSSKPSTVRLFNAPVTDNTSLTKILDRISQENIQADSDSNGYISVADEETARRVREVLISENLVVFKFFSISSISTLLVILFNCLVIPFRYFSEIDQFP